MKSARDLRPGIAAEISGPLLNPLNDVMQPGTIGANCPDLVIYRVSCRHAGHDQVSRLWQRRPARAVKLDASGRTPDADRAGNYLNPVRRVRVRSAACRSDGRHGEHEVEHGGGDHGLRYHGQELVVPGQAAPAAEPAGLRPMSSWPRQSRADRRLSLFSRSGFRLWRPWSLVPALLPRAAGPRGDGACSPTRSR